MDGQQELSRGVRGNGVGLQGAGRACGAARVSQTPLQRQSTAQGGGQPRGFWSQKGEGPGEHLSVARFLLEFHLSD